LPGDDNKVGKLWWGTADKAEEIVKRTIVYASKVIKNPNVLKTHHIIPSN